MEVSLQQILDAREQRAARQKHLLQGYHCSLICFTMNIAGPIKNSPLITQGFQLGVKLLLAQLAGSRMALLHREEYLKATGCEGFFLVDAPAPALKKLTTEIENSAPIGRLFDMDVLSPDGCKLSREELGLPERKCLLCHQSAHICGRSRTHSVQQLQEKTVQILRDALWQEDSRSIASLAVQSLLYEAGTTPKPGLVDLRNSGSHQDMDLFTFLSSSAALQPYFTDCALTGLQTAALPPAATFERIRFLGKQAEQAMLRATGGINTHKGAIFSLGILCAAAGRLEKSQRSPEAICSQAAAMTAGLSEADLGSTDPKTVGEKLYNRYGITGVRGQAEAGFPAVLTAGLPTLEAGLSLGLTLPVAGSAALLKLMCAITDTNLIARSDLKTQQALCLKISALLEKTPFPSREVLETLDDEFIGKNLSPGGSADLLAASYFLYFLKKDL